MRTVRLIVVTITVAAAIGIAPTPRSASAELPQQFVEGATMIVDSYATLSSIPSHRVWNDIAINVFENRFDALRWTPAVGYTQIELTLPTGTPLASGVYVDNETGRPDEPDVEGSLIGECGLGDSSGTFILDEFVRGADSAVLRLAGRWMVSCPNGGPASYGSIDYNASNPYMEREFSEGRLDFDTSGGKAATPLTIDITNHGPASLHVHNIQLTGVDADQFTLDDDPCTGATVPVGGVCTVVIGFHPTIALHISDAGLNILDDISSLSGFGRGQEVRLSGGKTDLPTGEFTAVTPARVLDTRTGIGAPTGPLKPNSATNVQITGRAGVPTFGASAVVLNVTAVGSTSNSFVTLWATNGMRPWVSNLNPTPGKVVANMATVPIGGDGKISVYNALGTTHLLFDVVGYYVWAGALGARYHGVDPYRMIDTRLGVGGVPVQQVGAGQSLTFNVLDDLGSNPAAHVTGIVMNVTAVGPTATSFLTVHPADTPRPNTSNLNFDANVTVPNLVTVRVPVSGLVSFYNDTGSTDVIVDVVGFYSDERIADSGRFQAVTPVRAFDTRYGDPIGEDDLGIFQVAGYDGVPAWAAAVVLNVTAVSPSAGGYLSVFPDDLCILPVVSNLNFSGGQTIPNMVVTRLSQDRDCAVVGGAVDIYNATGTTHVLVDVAGYFL